MTFIEVNSTTNSIRVNFNVLAEAARAYKATFDKASLHYVMQEYGTDYLTIYMDGAGEWQVRHDATLLSENILPVSTVNGVVPTDLDHLYNLLIAMFDA